MKEEPTMHEVLQKIRQICAEEPPERPKPKPRPLPAHHALPPSDLARHLDNVGYDQKPTSMRRGVLQILPITATVSRWFWQIDDNRFLMRFCAGLPASW